MTTTLDIASGAPAAPALRAQMDQGAFAAAVFVLVLFAEPVFAYLTKIEAPDTAIRLIWLPVYAVIAPFLIGRGPQVLAAACRTPLLLALGGAGGLVRRRQSGPRHPCDALWRLPSPWSLPSGWPPPSAGRV
jgi:hypothetical protein